MISFNTIEPEFDVTKLSDEDKKFIIGSYEAEDLLKEFEKLVENVEISNITTKDFMNTLSDIEQVQHTTEYLKKKYSCYGGVPYQFICDETLLLEPQVKQLVAEELGLKVIPKSKMNDIFIDFKVVAEWIVWNEVQDA